LLLSIGVGTATMKNVQSLSRAGSAVSSIFEPVRSPVVTSAVSSWPRFSSSIRFWRMSKPMVGSLRANDRATGRPT
jgi:hypothetical protein